MVKTETVALMILATLIAHDFIILDLPQPGILKHSELLKEKDNKKTKNICEMLTLLINMPAILNQEEEFDLKMIVQ